MELWRYLSKCIPDKGKSYTGALREQIWERSEDRSWLLAGEEGKPGRAK